MNKYLSGVFFIMEIGATFLLVFDCIMLPMTREVLNLIVVTIAWLSVILLRLSIKCCTKSVTEAYPILSKAFVNPYKFYGLPIILLYVCTVIVIFHCGSPNDTLSVKAVDSINSLHAFDEDSVELTLNDFRKYPVFYQWNCVEASNNMDLAAGIFTDVINSVNAMSEENPDELDVATIGESLEEYSLLVKEGLPEVNHTNSNIHKTIAFTMILLLSGAVLYIMEFGMYSMYITMYEEGSL